MYSDTELLEFLISQPDVKLFQQRDKSYVVWDTSNGLIVLGHAQTAREALSQAKASKEG